MRILITLVLSLLASLALANPYSELSDAELRRKLAAFDPVHKQNWYQVEVLLFERRGPTASEYWRLDQRPALAPANAIHPGADGAVLPEQADTIDQHAARLGAWRFLPAESRILVDMLGRMERSGSFRVLYHQAWRQPVRARNEAFPLYLQGEDMIAVATDPATREAPLDFGLPPLQPSATDGSEASGISTAPAQTMQPALQGMLRLHLSRYLHVEPDIWLARRDADNTPYWVRINQNRRMRSEELHYIDHPLFGMLLRLTPWQTDQQKEMEQIEQALRQR